MKKIVATVLATALCAAMVPMAVSAAEADLTRGDWTLDGSNYKSSNNDFGNDFTLKHLGNSDTVSITATVTLGDEFGFMFGITDKNGNGIVEEGADQYYLLDFRVDGNKRVGIERNDGNWGGWKKQTADLADNVTITVTYVKGMIVVEVDGEEVLAWQDVNPLPGTGFGLIAKRCEATFTNVKVNEKAKIADLGAGDVEEGDLYGDWTKDGSNYKLNKTENGYGNDKFAAYVLGNTDKKVTLTADITASARNGWGGDTGFLFAVSDRNGDGEVKETGDYYYLVEISCTEDHFIGIEKNTATWTDWAARYDINGMEAGKTYTLSATYDPAAGKITVSLDGEVVLEYTDATPLQGTGYALASKTYGAEVKNVSVDVDEGTTGGDTGSDKTEESDKTEAAPTTGSASIAIAAVAVISLAGVVVATKKREQD